MSRRYTYVTAMKQRAIATGLAAGLLLSACAAQPTPYLPRDGAFGYAQTQIDSQTWRVLFAGNPDTPRETVENYLLYRAAEIMLFGNREKFIILEKELERTRDYRGVGPYSYGFGGNLGGFGYHRRRTRAHLHTGFGTPNYYALDSYKAYATIRTYSGGPTPAGLQVYSARDVIARLGPSVTLPE